jgi:hypothetical protein
MERPSFSAALAVPFLRQQMVEIPRESSLKRDSVSHAADVLIEKYSFNSPCPYSDTLFFFACLRLRLPPCTLVLLVSDQTDIFMLYVMAVRIRLVNFAFEVRNVSLSMPHVSLLSNMS